jgi:hypothetical protein
MMLAAYFDWINLYYRIDGYFLGHWFAIAGVLFIVIYTPVFYVLKRRYPENEKILLGIHVFGSLFSFLLVSIHFAQLVSPPALIFSEGRTGAALYLVLVIIVVTGVIHRFGLLKSLGKYGVPHRNRFVHIALTLAFYLVLVFHVLRGLGFI